MMRKYINLECLFNMGCAVAVLIISANFVAAQSKGPKVKDANWQYSVPPTLSRGSAQLGIRDKHGDIGSFSASFVVTAPGKRVFRAKTAATGDEWAYADFPADFDGKPATGGTYSVVFYANGVVVGRSKFKFRP